MAKVDPWAPPLSGTVQMTHPGPVLDNVAMSSLIINTSGLADVNIPIFSGTADTAEVVLYNHAPKIPAGKKVYVWTWLAVNANQNAGNGRQNIYEVHASGTSKDSLVAVVSAKATGPYHLALDLPLEFKSSETAVVYAKQIKNLRNNGATGPHATNQNNWATICYTMVDE